MITYLNQLRHHMMSSTSPVTRDWFLMKDPLPLVFITLLYLIGVWAGKRFMNERKAYNMRSTMLLYNIALVGFSVYMFVQVAYSAWSMKYSLVCEPVNHEVNEYTTMMGSAIWLFFFTKLIELMDTVFIIAHKKFNQLSFLHVFHHATTMWFTWWGASILPGGQSWLCTLLNTFVHTLMYTYFALASFGPSIQKYLWWKRYLTIIQMTQFCILITHNSISAFFMDCGFPRGFSQISFFHCIFLLFLFLHYYISSRQRDSSAKKESLKKQESAEQESLKTE